MSFYKMNLSFYLIGGLPTFTLIFLDAKTGAVVHLNRVPAFWIHLQRKSFVCYMNLIKMELDAHLKVCEIWLQLKRQFCDNQEFS